MFASVTAGIGNVAVGAVAESAGEPIFDSIEAKASTPAIGRAVIPIDDEDLTGEGTLSAELRVPVLETVGLFPGDSASGGVAKKVIMEKGELNGSVVLSYRQRSQVTFRKPYKHRGRNLNVPQHWASIVIRSTMIAPGRAGPFRNAVAAVFPCPTHNAAALTDRSHLRRCGQPLVRCFRNGGDSMVPMIILGVMLTIMGAVLTLVDHPAAPELSTLGVGVVLLIAADWIDKRHSSH